MKIKTLSNIFKTLTFSSLTIVLCFLMSSCTQSADNGSMVTAADTNGPRITADLLEKTNPKGSNLDKPAILFYYADWCPYCQKMKPQITELQKKFGNKVTFRMIDVDTPKGKEIAAGYRKTQGGIPYTQYFSKEGFQVNEILGFVPYEQLEKVTKTSFKL